MNDNVIKTWVKLQDNLPKPVINKRTHFSKLNLLIKEFLENGGTIIFSFGVDSIGSDNTVGTINTKDHNNPSFEFGFNENNNVVLLFSEVINGGSLNKPQTMVVKIHLKNLFRFTLNSKNRIKIKDMLEELKKLDLNQDYFDIVDEDFLLSSLSTSLRHAKDLSETEVEKFLELSRLQHLVSGWINYTPLEDVNNPSHLEAINSQIKCILDRGGKIWLRSFDNKKFVELGEINLLTNVENYFFTNENKETFFVIDDDETEKTEISIKNISSIKVEDSGEVETIHLLNKVQRKLLKNPMFDHSGSMSLPNNPRVTLTSLCRQLTNKTNK